MHIEGQTEALELGQLLGRGALVEDARDLKIAELHLSVQKLWVLIHFMIIINDHSLPGLQEYGVRR
jgi:hypothetical protein